MRSRRFSSLALLAAVALVCQSGARAVIVSGSDGTQNTTAPVDDFGFFNVGRVFDRADDFYTSGVYLGNDWVLSAYHAVRDGSGGFQFRDVVLNGSSYSVDPATAMRLQNGDGSPADLALFQLTATPQGLSPVALAESAPASGAPVILMGNGVNRAAALTTWRVTGSGPATVWTESSGSFNASGHFYAGGQALRWGAGSIAGQGVIDDGFGTVSVLQSSFTGGGDAVAAPGDSGGGLFYKGSGGWELAGILLASDSFQNQPAQTAVFGNATYAASVAAYRSQIAAVVPEPPVFALGLLGAVLAGCRVAFRRARQYLLAKVRILTGEGCRAKSHLNLSGGTEHSATLIISRTLTSRC